jgi:hypothetical protein
VRAEAARATLRPSPTCTCREPNRSPSPSAPSTRTRITASCSSTRTSTRSSSARLTTGMPSVASTPRRPARISSAKSRSRIPSWKDAELSRRCASTNACSNRAAAAQRGNEYRGIMHVRNGSIGKVTRVLASNYCSPMVPKWPKQDIPEGLDWDFWCGPAEPPPYNFVIWDNRSNPSWVSIRPFSGGNMTDRGGHGLDIAQWGWAWTRAARRKCGSRASRSKTVTARRRNPAVVRRPQFAEGLHEVPRGHHYGTRRRARLERRPLRRREGNDHRYPRKASSDPAELIAEPVKNPKVELYRSPGITATGSIASRIVATRWLTPRPDTGRPPSATWATSRVG